MYSDTVIHLHPRRSQAGDQTPDDGSGLVEGHCLRLVLSIDVDLEEIISMPPPDRVERCAYRFIRIVGFWVVKDIGE